MYLIIIKKQVKKQDFKMWLTGLLQPSSRKLNPNLHALELAFKSIHLGFVPNPSYFFNFLNIVFSQYLLNIWLCLSENWCDLNLIISNEILYLLCVFFYIYFYPCYLLFKFIPKLIFMFYFIIYILKESWKLIDKLDINY